MCTDVENCLYVPSYVRCNGKSHLCVFPSAITPRKLLLTEKRREKYYTSNIVAALEFKIGYFGKIVCGFFIYIYKYSIKTF